MLNQRCVLGVCPSTVNDSVVNAWPNKHFVWCSTIASLDEFVDALVHRVCLDSVK